MEYLSPIYGVHTEYSVHVTSFDVLPFSLVSSHFYDLLPYVSGQKYEGFRLRPLQLSPQPIMKSRPVALCAFAIPFETFNASSIVLASKPSSNTTRTNTWKFLEGVLLF
jgi:hypothetical protein